MNMYERSILHVYFVTVAAFAVAILNIIFYLLVEMRHSTFPPLIYSLNIV